jgi:hypothetical protein
MVELWFFNELKKSPNGENSPRKKMLQRPLGKLTWYEIEQTSKLENWNFNLVYLSTFWVKYPIIK